MTWRDKLEIGLKEDAAFRKDNLPLFQVRGVEVAAGAGRSPEIPESRTDPVAPAATPADTGEYPDGATRSLHGPVAGTEADAEGARVMSDEGAPLRKED
jgi:hypothetical protein